MDREPKAIARPVGAGAASLYAVMLVLLLALASCAHGPVAVEYTPTAQQPKQRTTTVTVEPFTDARGAVKSGDPRTIGTISAAVVDIYGDRLTLSEDPATVVTKAFVSELEAAGYTVPEAGGQEKDGLVLSGEVRAFSLDIESRDRVDIELAAKLTDARTGHVLWSGTGVEKSERFAGVMGNSSATISKYLAASLSKVVGQVITGAGLDVRNTAMAPAQPAYEQAPAEPVVERKTTGNGKLSVTTEPARAKVYIGDVYYGLTPIVIEMEPGIYSLSIRHDGFKDTTEKVSVRDGSVTEFETRLKKE